jgi:hypothetical protein
MLILVLVFSTGTLGYGTGTSIHFRLRLSFLYYHIKLNLFFQARRPSQQMSPGKFPSAGGGAHPPPAFSPAAHTPQFSPVGGHHQPFSPGGPHHPPHPHLHRPASANSGSERSTPTSPMGGGGGRYGDGHHHHLGGGHQQQQQQQYHIQELGVPGEKHHRSSGSLEGSDSSSEIGSVRSSGGGADSTPGQVAAISSTDSMAATSSPDNMGEGGAFRPPPPSQHNPAGHLDMLGDNGNGPLTPEMGLQVRFVIQSAFFFEKIKVA